MSPPALLTKALLAKHPLPKVEAGDKDQHGCILVVAGSRDIPGAALLCATAAMRAGAGKLQIATVASAAPHLGLVMPEAMVTGYPEQGDGGFAKAATSPIAKQAQSASAVIAGPGMRENAHCAALAAALLSADIPVALDAALLHALPARKAEAKRAERPPVLLPHSGELAALLECDEAEVERDPLEAGRTCADRYDAITLVKGAQSHIVTPGGEEFLYKGGGPGLGISGSGDTLAGIVGGLLARGAEPLTALLWGVWLHGEAGAALSRKVGPLGFLARQIPDEIPSLLPR